MNKKWNIDPFCGYKGKHSWLKDRTIFIAVHGSQAYGTSIPGSDIDIKGLVVPPKEYFLGFSNTFEQAEGNKPYDMVLYEIRKFLKLASAGNPNIIEILFTDPEDWVMSTKLYSMLWENKKLFLSQQVKNTFGGYARQQLKRIKNHKKWIDDPPINKPCRSDFGLKENEKINGTNLGAMKKMKENGVEFDANVMKMFAQEQNYQKALNSYNQYASWKKSRNKKRASLEYKYGYDCKHAMHLVRLLRMAVEILSSGEVLVKRPDAKELIEIRNGSWSYEKLLLWSENQEDELEQAALNSRLPKITNRNNVDKICQEIVSIALEKNVLK